MSKQTLDDIRLRKEFLLKHREDLSYSMREMKRRIEDVDKELAEINYNSVAGRLCRVFNNGDNVYKEIERGVTIRLISHYDEDRDRFVDAHGSLWPNAIPVEFDEIKQYLGIEPEPYVHKWQYTWAKWWAVDADGIVREYSHRPVGDYTNRKWVRGAMGWSDAIKIINMDNRNWMKMIGERK